MRTVPRSLISKFDLSKLPSHLDPGFWSTPCVPICICFDFPLGYSYRSHLHNGLCQPRNWSVVFEGMDAGPEDGSEGCRQQHLCRGGQGLWPELISSLLGLGAGTEVLGARQVDWWDCRAAAVWIWQGSAHSLSVAALLAWLKQWLNPLNFPDKIIVPLSNSNKISTGKPAPVCGNVLLFDQALCFQWEREEEDITSPQCYQQSSGYLLSPHKWK